MSFPGVEGELLVVLELELLSSPQEISRVRFGSIRGMPMTFLQSSLVSQAHLVEWVGEVVAAVVVA